MTAKLIKICQRRTAWRKIRRPGARHATSLTLQPRQSPPAMRTSPPCRPGNRRPPVMPPFLHTDPTAAARRRRSLVKQTVVPRSRPCRPPPQPKGIEGHPEGPAVGRGRGGEGLQREGVAEGRGRGGKGSRREGTTEGRGAIGRPAAVSGMGLRRVWRSFFAGFVPFASLNIRFERVQTASQPYFYSRKRFTPRPHTHQIQPVAAPRQRSAPAGGSRDRHLQRLEDSLPFRPSVRHPETHGSGCRFVGS